MQIHTLAIKTFQFKPQATEQPHTGQVYGKTSAPLNNSNCIFLRRIEKIVNRQGGDG